MRTEYHLITFSDNNFRQEMLDFGRIIINKFLSKEFDVDANFYSLIYVFPNVISGLHLLNHTNFECEEEFIKIRKHITDKFVYYCDKERVFDFIESKLLNPDEDKSLVNFVRNEGGNQYWIHELQHVNCNNEILLFQFSWDDYCNPKSSTSGFCII